MLRTVNIDLILFRTAQAAANKMRPRAIHCVTMVIAEINGNIQRMEIVIFKIAQTHEKIFRLVHIHF